MELVCLEGYQEHSRSLIVYYYWNFFVCVSSLPRTRSITSALSLRLSQYDIPLEGSFHDISPLINVSFVLSL